MIQTTYARVAKISAAMNMRFAKLSSLKAANASSLIVVATLALIVGAMVLRVAFDSDLAPPPSVGSLLDPEFSLVDQNGRTFTDASFEGKPRLLTFGYTSCPDICPTTLSALAENITELGKNAGKLQWIFITVDPKHDTPARLKAYLAAFSPRIVGLTGSPGRVSATLDKYRVFRASTPKPDGTYSIDHTSTVFLISPDGHLRNTIKESELGTRAALTKIKRLISS